MNFFNLNKFTKIKTLTAIKYKYIFKIKSKLFYIYRSIITFLEH